MYIQQMKRQTGMAQLWRANKTFSGKRVVSLRIEEHAGQKICVPISLEVTVRMLLLDTRVQQTYFNGKETPLHVAHRQEEI